MFGKKDGGGGPKLVGAREKRLQAAILKGGQQGQEIQSKREGKGQDPRITALLIYGLSCGVAWLAATVGPFKDGVAVNTGARFIDDLLNIKMMGDQDMDFIIQILVRGLAVCLMAGFLPFMAFFWSKILDKTGMNVYLTVWGVAVGLPLIYLVLLSLGPIFTDLGKLM